MPAYRNNTRLLDTPQARAMIEGEGAIVIDVRYPGAFASGHLPGAINLAMRRMTSAALTDAIARLPMRPVLVACYERRSCFFGELLGLALTRAGRDFRGRYTVPWEYVPTLAKPAHIQALMAQSQRGFYERAVLGLTRVLDEAAQRWGFLAVLVALALLSRLVVLPFALKAERDQLKAAEIDGEVRELKARLAGDPVRKARALSALYDKHGMTPLRNVLALLGLPILAVCSTAVGKAAALGGYDWPLFGRLDHPDGSLVLPVVCGLLMAGYVDWVLAKGGRQQAACWLVGAPAMMLLMAYLPGAIALYVMLSLLLIITQRALVVGFLSRHDRRRRRVSAGTVATLGIVDLADAEQESGIGSKARRLASMVAAGMVVPRGVVLTPRFIALWQATPPEGRGKLERMVARAAGRGPFAVRSTAEGEDGAQASHAGVFETVTDVPAAQLGVAIERVLASYASHRMASYTFLDGAMQGGVIVQEMVTADYAGVLFTRAPDAAGLALVEMVAGAGEALVSGERTPSTYRFGRFSGEPISAGAAPVGLGPLLEAGRRLEAVFGAPQDIEWVYANGRFAIVQARDITTGVNGLGEIEQDAWETALHVADVGDSGRVVAERNVMAEMLPAPTPVSASLVEALYAAGGSVDLACRRLGLRYRAGEMSPPLFPILFGRLYVNVLEQEARAPRLAKWQVKRLLGRAAAIEQHFRSGLAPELMQAGARARAIDFAALETGLLLTIFNELVDRFIREHHVEAEVINIVADLALGQARAALEEAGLEPSAYLARHGTSLVEAAVECAIAREEGARRPAWWLHWDIVGAWTTNWPSRAFPRIGKPSRHLRKTLGDGEGRKIRACVGWVAR
ncbi:MAG: PEP/pyruvate-binding domain-containing protein [Hyphomicrobiaceae bacterium]